MISRPLSRSGVTLVELVTVVAILGIMAGVAGAAFRQSDPPPAPGTLGAAQLRLGEARREAISTGSVVSVTVTVGAAPLAGDSDLVSIHLESPPRGDPIRQYRATAFPDGSIVADGALHVERLTGRPLHKGRRP